MNLKQRRAIYYTIAVIMAVVTSPVWIIALIASAVLDAVTAISDILKYKLKIYDENE